LVLFMFLKKKVDGTIRWVTGFFFLAGCQHLMRNSIGQGYIQKITRGISTSALKLAVTKLRHQKKNNFFPSEKYHGHP